MTDRHNWKLGASTCILRGADNHTDEGFASYKDAGIKYAEFTVPVWDGSFEKLDFLGLLNAKGALRPLHTSPRYSIAKQNTSFRQAITILPPAPLQSRGRSGIVSSETQTTRGDPP